MWYWIVVITLLVGVGFGLQNSQSIELHFIDFYIALPLSVALLSALGIGLVLGWIFHGLSLITRKRS